MNTCFSISINWNNCTSLDDLLLSLVIQRLQNYIFGKPWNLIDSNRLSHCHFFLLDYAYEAIYFADILMQYSRGKSALIFCSTRKGAQEAAQHISHIAMSFGHSNPFIKSREQLERLSEASLSCGDKQMQSYIRFGGKRSFLHSGRVSMRRLGFVIM